MSVGDGVVRAGPGERRTPGEQLVGHDAGRVDVRREAGPARVDELRTHVLGCADESRRGLRIAHHHRGDAEVAHPEGARILRTPLGVEQHVVGLDVAVHHVVLVRGGQRVEDGGHRGQRRARRQGPARVEPVAQRSPGDEVHDDRQLLALDDEVAEADDVGMPQGLQDGTLLDEPPHQVAVGGVLRVEELGGHAFARAQVGGGPDRTRGALPDLLDQTVRGTQGVVELLTDHLPPPAPTRRSAGTQPIIHARRTAPRSAPPWPDGPASVPRVR